jgi:hypothetical protein
VFLQLLVTLPTLLPANIAHCFDQSFAWDANTEPDIAGYYIYYKKGVSGPPYDGIGAEEGDSPIEIPLASLYDPENPEYTLHGLSDADTFYFVSTAYDIYGNESDFTPELFIHEASCKGDLDSNGVVDGFDLAVFSQAYAIVEYTADLDENDIINADDLSIFTAEFGRTDCL